MGSPCPQGTPSPQSSPQSSHSSRFSTLSSLSSSQSRSQSSSQSSIESSPASAPSSPQRAAHVYSYSAPLVLGFYRDEASDNETDGAGPGPSSLDPTRQTRQTDRPQLRPRPISQLVASGHSQFEPGYISEPQLRTSWTITESGEPAITDEYLPYTPPTTDGVYPTRGPYTLQIPESLSHISLPGNGAAWCYQYQGPELGIRILPGYYTAAYLQLDYPYQLRPTKGRCIHLGTPPICMQTAPLNPVEWPTGDIPMEPFYVHIVSPSRPTNMSRLVTNAGPFIPPVIPPNTKRGAICDRWKGWRRNYGWTFLQKRARLG